MTQFGDFKSFEGDKSSKDPSPSGSGLIDLRGIS